MGAVEFVEMISAYEDGKVLGEMYGDVLACAGLPGDMWGVQLRIARDRLYEEIARRR